MIFNLFIFNILLTFSLALTVLVLIFFLLFLSLQECVFVM